MQFANAAVEIAREAGAMLAENLRGPRTVEFKSTPVDAVTDMDRRVESFVVSELRKRFPDHAILGEEGTAVVGTGQKGTPPRYRWHVDPLDGTNNYLHRFPWFAVSLGLEEVDASSPVRRIVAGAVYHVMLDEMFWAERDQGAWLNGERLQVSSEDCLERALLVTGFPYWANGHPRTLMDNLEQFMQKAQGIRRTGSAALDLAYVASGRFDGYWEEGVKTWDVAAGTLLVREAGGVVSDYDGQHVAMPTVHIVAGNPGIHGQMVQMLRGNYRDASPRSEASTSPLSAR